MHWFLYDNGLRHERVKRSDIAMFFDDVITESHMKIDISDVTAWQIFSMKPSVSNKQKVKMIKINKEPQMPMKRASKKD